MIIILFKLINTSNYFIKLVIYSLTKGVMKKYYEIFDYALLVKVVSENNGKNNKLIYITLLINNLDI